MNGPRYLIRPRADRDLDRQALYYAIEATPEVGHRFLTAAHETFTLLAAKLDMGWPWRMKRSPLDRLRVFRVKGFEKSLVLYLPLPDGVEILRVIHGFRDIRTLLRRQGVE